MPNAPGMAIRLEPYLLATAQVHPDLAAPLKWLAQETAGMKLALVHGDVSPKNILIGRRGPVFLDAECAWYGDPPRTLPAGDGASSSGPRGALEVAGAGNRRHEARAGAWRCQPEEYPDRAARPGIPRCRMRLV